MASSAKEKKYRGAKRKRVPIMEAQFDKNGHQTIESMLHGRIDPAYLTRLLMEYKSVMDPFVAERDALAKVDEEAAAAMTPPSMGYHLGVCVDIIIKKTLGLPRWRDYTPAWHEEMYGHALVLIIRYVHGFNPEKATDPYNYVGMIAWNACNQIWNLLNAQSQRIKYIPLVDGIYHKVVSLDQYAGVLDREQKRTAELKRAELANSSSLPIDTAADIMREIDESAGIYIEDEWMSHFGNKRGSGKVVENVDPNTGDKTIIRYIPLKETKLSKPKPAERIGEAEPGVPDADF